MIKNLNLQHNSKFHLHHQPRIIQIKATSHFHPNYLLLLNQATMPMILGMMHSTLDVQFKPISNIYTMGYLQRVNGMVTMEQLKRLRTLYLGLNLKQLKTCWEKTVWIESHALLKEIIWLRMVQLISKPL